jgi:hypothetical protein
VVVHVRPRVEDPRSLRPVLAALVELARAARGEAVRGPYR